MTTLRVAGIGAGYFSRYHYQAWARVPQVQLVGLYNRTSTKAGELSSVHGVPAFDDVEAMLDATRPDLVDIITPPETHLAMIATCAARGIPMICQKPFTCGSDEARRAAKIAAEAEVKLVVHENFRWQPWYREAKKVIASGALGSIHNITFRLRPGDGRGPRAYLDRQPYFRKMRRFLVHETAVHLIDTFRFLLGEITAVAARLRRLNPAVAGEDAAVIVFEFEDGASGLFDGNRLIDHAAGNCRLTMGEMWVEGEEGVLRLDGEGRLWRRPHGTKTEEQVVFGWRDIGFGGDCTFNLQQHVIAHFLQGAALENTAAEYIRNLEIEDTVYVAAAERRTIELDRPPPSGPT